VEPLVCTLGARDQAARATEFREAFAFLTDIETLADGFRWRFRVVEGLEPRLRDLARREHECCRFFNFRIELQDKPCAIVWEARTTDDRARPILEEFMLRLPKSLDRDPSSMKASLTTAGLSFESDEF